ncbi:hypothetical protein C0J52_13270 [Blattella germanica]|nr:hypothetical protein C0J52_13270 [Blattella germanica]
MGSSLVTVFFRLILQSFSKLCSVGLIGRIFCLVIIPSTSWLVPDSVMPPLSSLARLSSALKSPNLWSHSSSFNMAFNGEGPLMKRQRTDLESGQHRNLFKNAEGLLLLV